MELNDFMDGRHNDRDKGFLVAEFVPPQLTGLPSRRRKFGSVSGSLTTDTELFKKHGDNDPCVTLAHLEGKLPKCRPKKYDPVPLELDHCEDLYTQVGGNLIQSVYHLGKCKI